MALERKSPPIANTAKGGHPQVLALGGFTGIGGEIKGNILGGECVSGYRTRLRGNTGSYGGRAFKTDSERRAERGL